MKGFKSTSTNPYTYTQSGVWKKGQYTFQAVVLSDSGYAFAFQRADTTWQTVDLSWQVKDGSYSKIQWTFTLEVDAVAFRLIANTVTGETIVLQPMLEKGSNGSTPIAHEEDLRGMDGDNHEFIFTRNTTGIAPEAPLSTQDDDYVPEDWTDNAQGVTSDIPFEFVSMRERKNGVWLDFSPPSLWAKWGEDGLSVNLLVEGHYKSHWEGIAKVVEIVGGVDVGGSEVVKVSAVFRKGEENIAATVSQSRGFQWYVNGVHLTAFDNQPFITLDETYGDGFADYVVLSYLVNSIREEERREIINISEGMDGIGEEFIFKANNSDTVPPVLPQTTDVSYQNDDYHGDWSDDPVAPTEPNQFVWTAKRKKVGGIWDAFGVPSVWTRWVEDGEDAIPPIIIDGYWAFWNDTLQDYEKSSFSAVGDDGHSPFYNISTGTWWEWIPHQGQYGDTGVKAEGKDGEDGEDGKDGSSAIIDHIFYLATSASSGVTVYTDGWKQDPSQTPLTPTNKYLWSYTSYVYTNGGGYYNAIPAIIGVYGDKGEVGHSPYINETTGTWWTWNEELGIYTDTGYSPVGSDGRIPYPAGYWEAKTYTRDANYAPYVQHTTAVYLLVEDSALSTDVPGISSKWKAFNNWTAVFVDSLVASFAKIGGAVFTGDTDPSSAIKGRMISQTGIDGTTSYQNYTGYSGAWQPKIMLDFLTGKANFEDVKVAGRIISPYATSLTTDVNNWIDVSTYSNFYVPTLPGGSGSGWYYTTLPSGSEYSGITLNFVWRPIGTGYAWRIQAASGMIHTPSGDKSYVELTSDTYRIVQLVGFWNTGTSRLEWILTDNRKWGNDKEDRVLAGEVFLTGYVNSTGAVLSTSSKFGFTFSSSKASTGQYSVTVNKYPYNPLSSSNYTQIITPYNPVYNTFSGLKTVNNASFGVYTNSDNAPIDSAFKFILIANEDLDLRNQTYL